MTPSCLLLVDLLSGLGGLGGSGATLGLALGGALEALLAELLLLVQAVLLEGSEPLLLLLLGLETTVAQLGGGVDELEGDLLGEGARGLGGHGAAQGDDTTLGSGDGALQHDVVVADNTVSDEATHGGDGLLSDVVVGGGVLTVNEGGLTDVVNLLVEVGTVVVTVLTGAGNSVAHALGMPGTNAGDLAQTTMGLTGQAGDAPTVDDTLETVTAGDGAHVAGLGLVEDGVDADLLLHELVGELELVSDGAAVDLDLLDEGLLGADAVVAELAVLGVSNHADDGGLLGEAVQGALGGGLALLGLLELLELGEGKLGGLLVVLVEAALELGAHVVGPDGAEALVADGGLTVSDDTDDDHRGSLEDGDGLDDLLLVDLGAGTVDVTDDVGHTGLEDHEGGQVGLLAGVVLGEGTAATAELLGALAGQETKMAVAGVLKLAVRHLPIKYRNCNF
eukprot:435147_1